MGRLIVTTSWDDGIETDVNLADMLEMYGIKGTFYVSRVLPNSLSEEELAAIGARFEIGAHTLNHVDLTKVSLSEARKEVEGSKTYLEDLLERKVHMFAYPDGKYDANIKKIVADAGFIAARTCKNGGFNLPPDPYEWQVTLLASNSSPLLALRICLKNHVIKGLLEWETRAKMLFDRALEIGGVYHVYGHSRELEEKRESDKLERVLDYISNREGVQYMTNGEIFSSYYQEAGHIR